MKFSHIFHIMPLSDIDLGDHPFTGFAPADLSPLKDSLKEMGLLSPPWLRHRQDGRFQVVAGLKRLQCAGELGWPQIPAFSLPPETADFVCLLLALHDNASRRDFSPLEQAHLTYLLLQHTDRTTVTRKFLPLLGLPPAPVYLERLLALAALEQPFQLLAHQGRLALTTATRLATWTPEERLALLPLLSSLTLSQSKQEELLDTLALLARRHGTTPTEVLNRREIQEIFNNQTTAPHEKAQALRRQLRSWLLPRLTAAEAAFAGHLRRLGLSGHPRIHLTPPPAFEGPDFHLKLAFRDQKELEQYLTLILQLLRNQELDPLLSI